MLFYYRVTLERLRINSFFNHNVTRAPGKTDVYKYNL